MIRRRSRMNGVFLALCIGGLNTGAVLADGLCTDLETAISLVPPANVSDTSGTSADQTEETCALIAELSKRENYHCKWGFSYRAPAATAAFAAYEQALRQCLGDRATESRDPGVNHPDFYDRRLFQTDSFGVSVSLKDKAALMQTFVFLRVLHGDAG